MVRCSAGFGPLRLPNNLPQRPTVGLPYRDQGLLAESREGSVGGIAGEAEPLMRRALEIRLQFTRVTGHPYPDLQAAIRNYSALLSQMGHSKPEILARLQSLGEQYGVSLGN